jgi:hypothetical protein
MLWAHRVRWLLLLLTYYIVLLTIRAVTYLGLLVVPMLRPVFAVGFLAAAWSQERGEVPAIRHLFAGFRANLRVLLLLGLFFVVGMTGAIAATWLVDGGKLLEVMSGATVVDEAFLATASVQAAMLFGALCALPVLLALWFAPALVVFRTAMRRAPRDEPACRNCELASDRDVRAAALPLPRRVADFRRRDHRGAGPRMPRTRWRWSSCFPIWRF